MKIAIVQGAFLPIPPLRGGAIEKAWFGLAKEFARRGHEVIHYSRACDGLPESEVIEGVLHQRVDGFDYPRNALLLKLRDLVYSRRIIRRLQKTDIIVTHTFWLPLLAPRADRGLVYVHVARFPKGQMSFYSGAARLQAVSKAVAHAIETQAPRLATRVKTLPLPLPEESLSNRSERMPSRTLLYVGRIHPEKGIELLIRAFSAANLAEAGWRLRIVGPHRVEQGGAGKPYLDSLKTFANPSVEFCEPIFDQATLRAEYLSAALFIYPSLAEKGETFGLAPLEAMASGCPTLVSQLECFRDFLSDGDNGWTFNHRGSDPVALLTQKLGAILGSADRMRVIGEKARTTAARFTLEEVAPAYLQDFSELMKAHR